MSPILRARLNAFRMPRTLSRILLAALLGLTGVASVAQTSDADAPPPPRDTTELSERLQATLNELKVPAAGVVIARGGQVEWVAGLGSADLQTQRAADQDTLFRIGSISKSLLALAILREVEAGRLDLQATVATLAPDMPVDNPWEQTDPVRLVHLLEHTAGFDDMHFQRMERDPLAADTAAQMRQFAPEFRVRWRPGERQSYSNPGYGLVAYILERHSGRDAREYISAEVLNRLGMHDTRWTVDANSDRIAIGYEDAAQPVPEANISMPTVGALWSTPADMGRYLQFFLDGNGVEGLIGADALRRMETPVTSLASRAGFAGGYALANYASDMDGWRLRGHSGGLPGYLAYLQYEREAGFGFVVMLNAIPDSSRPLRQLLLQYASAGLQPPSAQPISQTDPAHAGWYQQASFRNELLAGPERLLNIARLQVDETQYRLVHPLFPSGEDEYMEPIGANQVRDNGLTQSNGVFTTDADGNPVLVVDDRVFVRRSWWQTALPAYLATAAVILLALTLLVAPVWAWQWLRRGKTASSHPRMGLRFWPVLSALLLVLLVAATLNLSLTRLTQAQIDLPMVLIWLGGWAFGLSALIGSWQLLRQGKQAGGRFVRGLSLASSLGALGLATWLWQVQLLGVRLWAW